MYDISGLELTIVLFSLIQIVALVVGSRTRRNR